MNPKLILQFIKKDLRLLWPWIAAVIVSCGAMIGLSILRAKEESAFRFAWLHAPSAMGIYWLSYAVFLVRLVHSDGLVGDRPYWLARPVGWRDLLTAKFLTGFIVGFVPLLAYQVVDLYGSDVLALTTPGQLAMRTLYLTAIWGLPVCALAAVTRNTSQAALAVVVIGIAGSIAESLNTIRGGTPPYASWLAIAGAAVLLFLGGSATILAQYFRRRTTVTRAMLVSVFSLVVGFLWLLPPATLLAMHNGVVPVARDAGLVSLDSPRPYPANLREFSGGRDIPIPIRLSQLPEGWRVEGTEADKVKVSAGGETMVAPMGRHITPVWSRNHDQYWILLPVFRSFFERHKTEAWTVAFTMQMRYFGNMRQYRMPLQGSEFDIPGAAKCRTSPQSGVTFYCGAPFQIRQWIEARIEDPKTLANKVHAGEFSPMSLEVFPVGTQFIAGNAPGSGAKEAILEVLDPMGTAERRVELRIPNMASFR